MPSQEGGMTPEEIASVLVVLLKEDEADQWARWREVRLCGLDLWYGAVEGGRRWMVSEKDAGIDSQKRIPSDFDELVSRVKTLWGP